MRRSRVGHPCYVAWSETRPGRPCYGGCRLGELNGGVETRAGWLAAVCVVRGGHGWDSRATLRGLRQGRDGLALLVGLTC